MAEKNIKWYKISDSVNELQFENNNLLLIKVNDKKICLVKRTNDIKACTANCPHAGGEMTEGFLDKDENIVCPLHRYVFNLNNGRDLNNEGYYLKIYPVKVSDEGVFVGIEEKNFFSWWK